MARLIRKNGASGNSPSAKGKGRKYVPMIPGSGQDAKGYWNQLIMRPEKNGYNTSYKSDPRFPVLDDTGHEVARPADHQTDASRRGGDRVKPNHGGPIEREIL